MDLLKKWKKILLTATIIFVVFFITDVYSTGSQVVVSYNFTAGGGGISAWNGAGYQTSGGSVPPVDGSPFPQDGSGGTPYTNVTDVSFADSTSDSTTASGTSSYYPLVIFQVKIKEDVESIDYVNMTWYGRATSYAVRFWIFNASSLTWWECAPITSGTANLWRNCVVNDTVHYQDFINATGYLHFMVQASQGSADSVHRFFTANVVYSSTNNPPPSLVDGSTLFINSTNPHSNLSSSDDVTCAFIGTDPNGDQINATIRWWVNDTLVATNFTANYNSGTMYTDYLSHSYLNPTTDNTIKCEVTLYDTVGGDSTIPVNSSTYTSYGERWWDDDFSYCQTINLTNPTSSLLVDFPVLVNVTSNLKMQDDFDDVRFVNRPCNTGGESLDYEVDNYTTSGNMYAWVRLPSFKPGTNKISIYYGNATISQNQENASNVWKDDYLVVLHFNDIPSDAPESVKDSTKYGYNATLDKAYSGDPIRTSGKIGQSWLFNGVENFLKINSNLSQIPISNQLTIESWIVPLNANNSIVTQWNETGVRNWLLNVGTFYGAMTIRAQFDTHQTGGDEWSEIYSQSVVGGSVWNYVAGTKNLTAVSVNVNGVFEPGEASTTLTAGDVTTRIGSIEGDIYRPEYPRAFFDEIRISNTSRSKEWLNATYSFQSTPSSFTIFYSRQSKQGVNHEPNELITDTTLFINSTSPTTNQSIHDVVCSFVLTDEDITDQLNATVRWYINDVLVVTNYTAFITNGDLGFDILGRGYISSRGQKVKCSVQVLDNNESYEYSDFVTSSSYTILNSPLHNFSLVSPSNSSGLSGSKLFSWNNAIDNDTLDSKMYNLLISKSPDFEGYEIINLAISEDSGTTTTHTLDGSLTLEDSYYWKVMAYNPLLSSTSWGDLLNFSFDNAPMVGWTNITGMNNLTLSTEGVGYYFDNDKGNYMGRITNPGLDIVGGAIEIWASYDRGVAHLNRQALLFSYDSALNSRLYLHGNYTSTGEVNMSIVAGDWNYAVTPYVLTDDNRVHQYVLTWNSTNLFLYVDGVYIYDYKYSQFKAIDDYLYIGRSNDDPQFNWTGIIGGVKFYNRQLKPWEIIHENNTYQPIYSETNYFTYTAGDTCTYGGSGDWVVDASDNCIINENTFVDGKIILYGEGTMRMADGIQIDAIDVTQDAVTLFIFGQDSKLVRRPS